MTVWLTMVVSQRKLIILVYLIVALVSQQLSSAIECHLLTIVEVLQVGFTQSTVTVIEDAGLVTLTIAINQNSWVNRPVTVTYSTSEVVGAINAASKFCISN